MTQEDPLARPEVQWGVGCLLGGSALVGLFILTLLVALILQPPAWLQVIIGILLVAMGAAITWLTATALARSRDQEDQRRDSN